MGSGTTGIAAKNLDRNFIGIELDEQCFKTAEKRILDANEKSVEELKTKMNVLSLFDGISCGQVALQRAGIKVGQYFASEIDKHAIEVTQRHYPKTIQLGNIKNIELDNLPKIDLLMGGSPCQGFSFAGKRLNFDDPRSKLFFDYVGVFQYLNKKNLNMMFLLENVKMKKEYVKVISTFMGVDPIIINSSLLSKQNRERLYWTNISFSKIMQKDGCDFDQYLYRLGHGYIKDEIKFFKKYPTLTAQSPATKYRIVVDIKGARKAFQEGNLKALRVREELTRCAYPEECENFQTLPLLYTLPLNETQRYKCIGNGWTVNVIAHIFNGLLLKSDAKVQE